jgi:ribosomal protein L27
MKLEVGKKYLNRDGKIVLITEKTDDIIYEFTDGINTYLRNGNFWQDGESNGKDLVSEYTEDKVFKIEAGKRYYTRTGKITEPVEYKESSDWGKDYPIYAKVKGDVGFYFTTEGRRLTKQETPEDLVKEYEEKKKLTLPLQVGKKYVTVEGDILKIEKHKHFDYIVQGVNDRGEFRMYYYLKTGEANIEECKYSLVSDYIEDSSELPKPEAKKEKKNPIKYSDLTFYEAWSLAKETKKRYRLKGSEWLEFPNVKVNKETFAKIEWEVEK